jgi:PncC family amidohydrolase
MDINILAETIVKELTNKGLKVSFAESCTGGMISSAVTSVPGSSRVLDLAVTTYADSAKIQFTDVTQGVLDEHGAVSSQTALLMASGIRRASKSDIGVSVTGIAGPDGGSDEKPVGTVYIAVNERVECFLFLGNRQEIRKQTTKQTLKMLQEILT